MNKAYEHQWEDTTIYCEDCGEHPAVVCANPDCPCDGEVIDLCREDDPRG